MKRIFLFSLILLILIGILLVRNLVTNRNPAQIIQTSSEDKEQLKKNIQCALKIISESDPDYNDFLRERSEITLNFLYERLSEGFAFHNVVSSAENLIF